jgi:hypothetical protein
MLDSHMVIFRLYSTEIKTLLLSRLENLSQKVYLRVMCGEVKALCFFKPFCPTSPHHLKSHTLSRNHFASFMVVSIIV